MAAEGTLFSDFHTLGAECSPSRASWFTGRSPSDKRVRIHLVIGDHATNVKKGCADYINTTTATVTSTLQAAG
jgi:arylsulfatase A-like enzyme